MKLILLALFLAIASFAQPIVTSSACSDIASITTTTYCVARAGYPITLTATSVSSPGWQFIRDTAENQKEITIPSPLSTTVTVILPYFGEWRFRVTGTGGSREFVIGAVPTNDYGNVVFEEGRIGNLRRLVFGPIKRYGLSAGPTADSPNAVAHWPTLDRIHREQVQHFLSLTTGGAATHTEDWETPYPGATAAVTNGSATVTFTGLDTQVVFCGGSGVTTVPTAIFLITWRTIGPRTGRRHQSVKTCPTSSTITIDPVYPDATEASIQFSVATEAKLYYHWSGNTGINYYDAVVASYALYYRTGLKEPRTHARQQGARWWRSPPIDEGRIAGTGTSLFSRGLSFPGLAIWAADVNRETEVWDGFYLNVFPTQDDLFWGSGGLFNNGDPTDDREEGNRIKRYALRLIADPNASRRTATKVHADALLAFWMPSQRNDLNYRWRRVPDGFHGSNVTVTNGSHIVTGTGFSAGMCSVYTAAQDGLLFMASSSDQRNADPTVYRCQYIDSTTLHLVAEGSTPGAPILRPYEGTSGTKAMQRGAFLGQGTFQPYFVGFLAAQMDALGNAYDLLGDTVRRDQAKSWLQIAADWIIAKAYWPEKHGVQYAGGGASCPVLLTPGCLDSTPTNPAFYAQESNALWYRVAQHTGNTSYLTYGDIFIGGSFGSGGGPQAFEDHDAWVPNPAGATGNPTRLMGRILAFPFAAGENTAHAGARNGGFGTYTPQTVLIGGNNIAAVTVFDPWGNGTTTACTSPCSVTIDARWKNVFYTINYTDRLQRLGL